MAPTSLVGSARIPMLSSMRATRWLLGILFVLHGLGHAILPALGVGILEPTRAGRLLGNLGWMMAMLLLIAGGLGVIGAWPFRRFWRPLALVGSAFSVASLIRAWRPQLGWGIALDVVVLLAVILLKDAPRPERRSAARRAFGWIGSAVAIALFGYFAVAAIGRPFMRDWGTTEAEKRLPLPGDWPNRDPLFEVSHAVTVNAPPEQVWPWLAQIGQDRGGLYSYAFLENAIGLHFHNADRVHPEWQDVKPGDLIRAAPPRYFFGLIKDAGWRVTEVVPERALVLKGWGTFALLPTPDGKTRLIARSKFSDPKVPVWGAALTFAILELPHFVMERKMLLRIKERAEKYRPSTSAAARRPPQR